MAGELYDIGGWPDGRVGRLTAGDLAGHYVLVVPDSGDRWLVFVMQDPDQCLAVYPHQEDWLLEGGQAALTRAFGEGGLTWLEGEEEASVESRVFDLRRTWVAKRKRSAILGPRMRRHKKH